MDIDKKGQEDDFTIGKSLLSWQAPEYHHYDKSTDWYWWVGLVAIMLLGFAVWQGSFLFGVLVLVGWFTIILYAVRKPQIITFSINEKGVVIEKTFYPWHTLKSFWIFYNPPLLKELSLESQKTLMPYIKIPLGDTNPDQVKEALDKYLPEEEQQESIIDNLSHIARF